MPILADVPRPSSPVPNPRFPLGHALTIFYASPNVDKAIVVIEVHILYQQEESEHCLVYTCGSLSFNCKPVSKSILKQPLQAVNTPEALNCSH